MEVKKHESCVTSFCWEIKNFRDEWIKGSESGDENMKSEEFPMKTRPQISFQLCFDASSEDWTENLFLIHLIGTEMEDNEVVKISYNIWFRTDEWKNFYEQPSKKYYMTANVPFFGHLSVPEENTNDFKILKEVYDNNGSFTMCCEIVDLSTSTVEYLSFCQNQWKLFESGVHDAKIFVGQKRKEFKILKTFFMAQSPVFLSMFQSDFKEAKENEVWIKEMDEETMLELIRWLYTTQINFDAPVEKLFEAADKYQIKMLKDSCAKRMALTLNIQNVFSRLAIASLYGHKDLEKKILKYVDKLSKKEMAECLMSREWFNIITERPQAANEISKLVLSKMK